MSGVKPIKKIVKPLNGQLVVYVVRPIPRKFQEIINTLREGPYNTKYQLNKFFSPGRVSAFIKEGLEQGYLKQKWVLVGTRPKAILQLVY